MSEIVPLTDAEKDDILINRYHMTRKEAEVCKIFLATCFATDSIGHFRTMSDGSFDLTLKRAKRKGGVR